MGKTFKYLFGIGAAIILIFTALFLIITYWEKIVACTTASARVASNILGQFTGGKDSEDPSDYYDI